jgi:hypothetical protein
METRASRLAISSLVLGILALLLLLICLGPVFAIPAVICGHMAYSRIGKSAGQLSGREMALGGLITGYISIGLSLFLIPLMAAIAIPNFVRARETAQRNACINNLRQIEAAKELFALDKGAEIGQPITEQNLDPYLRAGFRSFTCPAGGIYSINVIGEEPTCSITGHTLSDPADMFYEQ